MNHPGRKIGIMGGTFDPIHYGHLLIAENAADQFSLDEVLFLPTGYSPHKVNRDITAAKLRCDMVSLAIQNNARFSLSLKEVTTGEINFTFKTLESFKNENPNDDLFFIMGGDSLFDFDGWLHPERILKVSAVLAAVREDWEGERFDLQIAYLNDKFNGSVFRLNTPNSSISSQDIRKRVSLAKSVRYMLPEQVLSYIQENHLYQA